MGFTEFFGDAGVRTNLGLLLILIFLLALGGAFRVTTFVIILNYVGATLFVTGTIHHLIEKWFRKR